MASHFLQIPGQAGNDVWIYGFCRATSDYERMARASGEEVCNTPFGECCLRRKNFYLCEVNQLVLFDVTYCESVFRKSSNENVVVFKAKGRYGTTLTFV